MNDLSDAHKLIRKKTEEMLVKRMVELDIDIVFTHDFIFIGWYLPYGLGVQDASKKLPDLGWMHWVHSVPTAMSDWWYIKRDYGPKHKIIYPNKSDRTRVAEQFRGFDDDVRVIPHPKDLRTYFDFDPITRSYIDLYPGLMQADIVALLPASVDRLSSKRVAECMWIMGQIKALGRSVFFLVANQWATGKQQKEDTDRFAAEGGKVKLVRGKDFAFTSDHPDPKLGVGVPMRVIRELFLCTNLFLFPTREESFGLVMPEASLAGGPLMVLNKSLQMQMEVSGNNALYFEFGSYHNKFTPPHGRYWEELAKIILARFDQSESLLTKTFCRKTYNLDNLYTRYYAPVMSELKHL
jgi:hypothetical protein